MVEFARYKLQGGSELISVKLKNSKIAFTIWFMDSWKYETRTSMAQSNPTMLPASGLTAENFNLRLLDLFR